MGGCVNLHISLVTVVLSSFKPLCLDLSLVFFLHVLDMRFSRHLFETDYFGAWKPFVGKKNPLLKVWKPSKNLLFWCVWKGFWTVSDYAITVSCLTKSCWTAIWELFACFVCQGNVGLMSVRQTLDCLKAKLEKLQKGGWPKY